MPAGCDVSAAVKAQRHKVVKPGAGTLSALRHVCPLCSAALGVRCVTPTGFPRMHVHSKRMDLARDAIAKAEGGAA